jgi:hypothetical protein
VGDHKFQITTTIRTTIAAVLGVNKVSTSIMIYPIGRSVSS